MELRKSANHMPKINLKEVKYLYLSSPIYEYEMCKRIIDGSSNQA